MTIFFPGRPTDRDLRGTLQQAIGHAACKLEIVLGGAMRQAVLTLQHDRKQRVWRSPLRPCIVAPARDPKRIEARARGFQFAHHLHRSALILRFENPGGGRLDNALDNFAEFHTRPYQIEAANFGEQVFPRFASLIFLGGQAEPINFSGPARSRKQGGDLANPAVWGQRLRAHDELPRSLQLSAEVANRVSLGDRLRRGCEHRLECYERREHLRQKPIELRALAARFANCTEIRRPKPGRKVRKRHGHREQTQEDHGATDDWVLGKHTAKRNIEGTLRNITNREVLFRMKNG